MGPRRSTQIPKYVGKILSCSFSYSVCIFSLVYSVSYVEGALLTSLNFYYLSSVFLNRLNLLLCSYVVDAADHDNLSISKSELHDLLNKPSLRGIPLLVLGNKIDKPGALSKQALTDEM